MSWGHETLPRLDISYFEAAAADIRNQGGENEDFLAYHSTKTHFLLIVCDGVGQSASSGVAARLLGITILDVLKATDDSEKIASKLEIIKPRISNKIDALVGSADKKSDPFLERAWREHGAEVQFALLSIDYGGDNLNVYRVGNIQVAIFKPNGELVLKTEDNGLYWTTKKAEQLLKLECIHLPVSQVERIFLATDGISNWIDKIVHSKPSELLKTIRSHSSSNLDDIAGLDVRVRKRIATAALKPSPQNLRIMDGSLHWDRIKGADQYRIFQKGEAADRMWTVDKKSTQWKLPNEEGSRKYQLQALSKSALSSSMSPAISVGGIWGIENYRLTPQRKALIKRVILYPASAALIFLAALLGTLINPPSLEATISALASPGASELSLENESMALTQLSAALESRITLAPTSETHMATSLPPTESESDAEEPSADELLGLSECQKLNYQTGYFLYHAKQYDTFYALGESYSVGYEELMAINCYLDPLTLHIHDILIIPIIEEVE